jgi:trk system potassium uptake protein TrkH
MNYRLIIRLISNMLKAEAVFMIIPLAVSVLYGGDDRNAFALSTLILLTVGVLLSFVRPEEKNFKIRDAFAAAALSWLAFSFFGALPFYFSGLFDGYIDCFFESVSGFTTTGATVLADVESMPRGIIFWRSFSHWIGGMGVIVFMMAVLPSTNASAINLMKAETPGPSVDRLAPKMRETAGIMYLIYLSMTVILIVILVFTGLPFYDAVIHGLSVAGTGGFSNMNASAGAYGNIPAEIIIMIFMLLFGVNFNLYFLAFKNFKQVFKDEELKFYASIVTLSASVITLNITKIYGSLWQALRYSSFHVSSIITTTGFFTVDYDMWPVLSRIVLLLLMITGACAGSTGGGIKLVRFLIIFKAIKTEIGRAIHPQSVKVVTLNGKRVDNDTVSKVGMYFFIYFAIFIASILVISLEGKDMVTNATATVSALSNVGLGLELVGPTSSYADFNGLSKITLIFCMLAGRLEFFPLLILFKSSLWTRKTA